MSETLSVVTNGKSHDIDSKYVLRSKGMSTYVIRSAGVSTYVIKSTGMNQLKMPPRHITRKMVPITGRARSFLLF